MKANEAPEKIYLQKYDTDTFLCLNKYNIHEEWTERPICSNSASCNDIEYIRTDAFIEKVCDWFRRIDYDDSIPPYETTEEFIEGFKIYMKGE